MKVNEIFYSLEGEGKWQGYPTIFIRLSGCNLDCDWCDTEHQKFQEMEYNQIREELDKYPCNRVKVTGGEPLIHEKTNFLIGLLKDWGYDVALETNGTIFNTNIFNKVDLICMDIKPPSSKMESQFDVINRTHKRYGDKTEFKIVISDLLDLNFAESYVLLNGDMVLMPNSKIRKVSQKKRLMEAIMYKFPDARYGLRLHEVLGIR